jgi:hypothetical protein
VFGGEQMAMFSAPFKYTLPGINTDDIHELSRELIDLHHGDGDQLGAVRQPYAELIQYLPQGIQTTVYPHGYKDSQACFGQSVLLDEETADLTLRTVIVYDDVVGTIDAKVQQELSKNYLGEYWISSPSVSITDNIAVIDEGGPISEGGN